MRENASSPSTGAEICAQLLDLGKNRRIVVCHREPHEVGSWHEELYRHETGESSRLRWSHHLDEAGRQWVHTTQTFTDDVAHFTSETSLPGYLWLEEPTPIPTVRTQGKTNALERVTRGYLESARVHEWDAHCETALAIVAER